MPSSATEGQHISVLLQEAIDALRLRSGGTVVDGTFGGGGHTSAMLASPTGIKRVIGFDADVATADRAEHLKAQLDDPERLTLVHANFADISQELTSLDIEAVDGLLLDLGLSSFQLDQAARGFAFRFDDAPLDMRFDQTSGTTAAELIAMSSIDQLIRILRDYGEEPQARRIALAIGRRRDQAPIETARDLLDTIVSVTGPPRRTGIHPATRSFQALRIAVNREMESLAVVLSSSADILAPAGRLVVLSFHSLEDRQVKRFLEKASSSCICPPELPICMCDHLATFRKVGKPVRASDAEQSRNPRSRSVIMRVGERLSRDESLALKRTLRTRD